MSLLDELGIKYNTDKASRTRVRNRNIDVEKRPDGHNYLTKYEHFLQHLTCKDDLRIMELGAGPDWNVGASAYMWAEYFPNCKQIHIAEIRPSALDIKTDRIHPRIGDLSNSEFLKELGETQWDFILDDASHKWDHQILALTSLLSSVKDGGLFIMEDIHTSFGPLRATYHRSSGTNRQGTAQGSTGTTSRKRAWYKRAIRKARGMLHMQLLKLKVQPNSEAPPDVMTILSEIAYCVAGRNQFHPILQSSKHRSLVERISMQIESITFIGGSAILVKRSPDNNYLS